LVISIVLNHNNKGEKYMISSENPYKVLALVSIPTISFAVCVVTVCCLCTLGYLCCKRGRQVIRDIDELNTEDPSINNQDNQDNQDAQERRSFAPV
jgi:hypothetical protein